MTVKQKRQTQREKCEVELYCRGVNAIANEADEKAGGGRITLLAYMFDKSVEEVAENIRKNRRLFAQLQKP